MAGVLWAGSDDGRIHLSRDARHHLGGRDTAGVREVHAHRAHRRLAASIPAVVYVAANRYQQDDFAPYLWKSADYGKTWTADHARHPAHGVHARGARGSGAARPALRGHGVRRLGLDGRRRRPGSRCSSTCRGRACATSRCRGTTSSRRRTAASFWVIDDLSPLRQLADSVSRKAAHLFQPATAMLWAGSRGGNGTGENPPSGVLVDYWLRDAAAAKVKIEFTDAQGAVLRSFTERRLARDGGQHSPTRRPTRCRARARAPTGSSGTCARRARTSSRTRCSTSARCAAPGCRRVSTACD